MKKIAQTVFGILRNTIECFAENNFKSLELSEPASAKMLYQDVAIIYCKEKCFIAFGETIKLQKCTKNGYFEKLIETV